MQEFLHYYVVAHTGDYINRFNMTPGVINSNILALFYSNNKIQTTQLIKLSLKHQCSNFCYISIKINRLKKRFSTGRSEGFQLRVLYFCNLILACNFILWRK